MTGKHHHNTYCATGTHGSINGKVCNIQDTERESKITIGDTVIKIDYLGNGIDKTLYILFDKELKFKTCYFK